MSSPGLIVTGDFALATGADRHIAFAASLLARSGRALAWAWLVPADRVQIAASLHEAWQRPHPVACFGGLGNGVDDHVRDTVSSLQAGRVAVGLPRHPERNGGGVVECGNIAFFCGHPDLSHPVFEYWLIGHGRFAETTATPVECVRWDLPETYSATEARRVARQAFPTVAQRLVASTDGTTVSLHFTGPSKGKAQAARKLLQRELGRS